MLVTALFLPPTMFLKHFFRVVKSLGCGVKKETPLLLVHMLAQLNSDMWLLSSLQNVFHGPLHLFGKMLYRQMVVSGHSHHGNEKVKDRISCEQFVKAGKEVLRLFDEPAQHKYYFRLFSEGKDHLIREGTVRAIAFFSLLPSPWARHFRALALH